MLEVDSIKITIQILEGTQPIAMDSQYFKDQANEIAIRALKKCEELGITVEVLKKIELS